MYVTFAFPRNLTHGQHKNFVKHLVGLHAGVKVDWWGETKLTALLIGSEEGRAIATHFFHAEDPADLVDRATRVGGPLRTTTDMLEREGAISDLLSSGSPHFDFHTTNRPTTDEALPLTPRAAMRVEFGRGDQQLVVDAVPSTTAALEHYGPKQGIGRLQRPRPRGRAARTGTRPWWSGEPRRSIDSLRSHPASV